VVASSSSSRTRGWPAPWSVVTPAGRWGLASGQAVHSTYNSLDAGSRKMHRAMLAGRIEGAKSGENTARPSW
jgi:hypothetical protein